MFSPLPHPQNIKHAELEPLPADKTRAQQDMQCKSKPAAPLTPKQYAYRRSMAVGSLIAILVYIALFVYCHTQH
jgi:hypothetical protein